VLFKVLPNSLCGKICLLIAISANFGQSPLADRRIRGIFGRHVRLPVDKNRIAAERDRHSAPRTRESDDREASTESFLQNIREHLRLVRRMLLLDLTLARPNSLKVAIFAPKLKMQSYNINYLHNEQNSISISYQTHILARPHYFHYFIIAGNMSTWSFKCSFCIAQWHLILIAAMRVLLLGFSERL